MTKSLTSISLTNWWIAISQFSTVTIFWVPNTFWISLGALPIIIWFLSIINSQVITKYHTVFIMYIGKNNLFFPPLTHGFRMYTCNMYWLFSIITYLYVITNCTTCIIYYTVYIIIYHIDYRYYIRIYFK